jgi:hypothetical protein
MKQLGMSVSLVLAVGAPSTALAYPPQCYEVCSCEYSCEEPCYYFNYYRTTCAAEGAPCTETCRGSDVQASVSQEAQELREVQQVGEVCTEQTRQPASAEG